MQRKSRTLKSQVAVVDPDGAVRDSLVFALTIDGYSVRAFGSAAEFLACPFSARCDCLVTANRLPDLAGAQLADRWLQANPQRAAVLMVGKPVEAIRRPRLQTIVKPLDGAAATEAVAVALRSRRHE